MACKNCGKSREKPGIEEGKRNPPVKSGKPVREKERQPARVKN